MIRSFSNLKKGQEEGEWVGTPSGSHEVVLTIRIQQWIDGHTMEKFEDHIKQAIIDFGVKAKIESSLTGNEMTVGEAELKGRKGNFNLKKGQEGKRTFGFEYWYLDEYKGDITEVDIEHILGAMAEGYGQGELLTTDPMTEETHRGWWKKIG